MALVTTRLFRALLVAGLMPTMAFGSLPDVVCCCDLSFGPLGVWQFVAAQAERQPESVRQPERRTVLAASKAPRRCCCLRCQKRALAAKAPKVRNQDCLRCTYHLEAGQEAVPSGSTSVVASIDFPSVDLLQLDLWQGALLSDSTSQPSAGRESMNPAENSGSAGRGCALRQVWLI